MFKKWGLRSLIVVGAALGLFLVIAFALQVPAVGKTIGSPQACGTCHTMSYEVETLTRSAHRDLSCLDCHAAKGFVEKPIEEVKSASRHMFIFTTGTTPDVIKPTHESLEIIQANCVSCHATVGGVPHIAESRSCTECHRETPHGRPLRN